MFYVLLYVTLCPSSIAIILIGKRELVALLNLSSWCLVMVEQPFLAVPWGCLRFVIVVFPDHTHLLFFSLVSFPLLKVQQPILLNLNTPTEVHLFYTRGLDKVLCIATVRLRLTLLAGVCMSPQV